MKAWSCPFIGNKHPVRKASNTSIGQLENRVGGAAGCRWVCIQIVLTLIFVRRMFGRIDKAASVIEPSAHGYYSEHLHNPTKVLLETRPQTHQKNLQIAYASNSE